MNTFIIRWRRYRAIKKAKFYCWLYRKRYYVLPYCGGTRFLAINDLQESTLRKKQKTKRITFAKLIASAVYIAIPKEQ